MEVDVVDDGTLEVGCRPGAQCCAGDDDQCAKGEDDPEGEILGRGQEICDGDRESAMIEPVSTEACEEDETDEEEAVAELEIGGAHVTRAERFSIAWRLQAGRNVAQVECRDAWIL